MSSLCFNVMAAESGVTSVSSTLLVAEKEEAKAVLSLFLRKQGLSNAVAARMINKSDHFIDHLLSRLHSIHRSRYLVGSISHNLSITLFFKCWRVPFHHPYKLLFWCQPLGEKKKTFLSIEAYCGREIN